MPEVAFIIEIRGHRVRFDAFKSKHDDTWVGKLTELVDEYGNERLLFAVYSCDTAVDAVYELALRASFINLD